MKRATGGGGQVLFPVLPGIALCLSHHFQGSHRSRILVQCHQDVSPLDGV